MWLVRAVLSVPDLTWCCTLWFPKLLCTKDRSGLPLPQFRRVRSQGAVRPSSCVMWLLLVQGRQGTAGSIVATELSEFAPEPFTLLSLSAGGPTCKNRSLGPSALDTALVGDPLVFREAVTVAKKQRA